MATAAAVATLDQNVSSFVARKHKMLINGQWVEAASGKTFPSYNPATGEVLSEVAAGDKEDIDRAVKAARAAFDSGPWSKIPTS
ncbi:MAG: aldehyde dehydrogenase family protein, partial [Candidatus Acidiferrales bacterium]